MTQLADLLEANLEAMLTDWVALVSASLSPGVRSAVELVDHIPAFLVHVIAALREPALHSGAGPAVGIGGMGREHGAQRFRQGFALTAVVREYGLLLGVMLDLAEARGASVSMGELRRLNDIFTGAVAEAADEYARRLLEEEARETARADRLSRRDRQQSEAARESAEALAAKLRESEETFRTLAEALPDAVWRADAAGSVLWMNAVLPRATGQTFEGIRRDGLLSLVHPDDRPVTTTAWESARESGAPFGMEHRVRQADGAFRWHLVRLRPIHDGGGAVDGWVGTSTDIHERREHQAELERRHDFEKHLVGIVSHDLRNPLSAILLGAAALLEGESSPWTVRIAQRIRSSAERSVRMISDLLDFTQARLGGGIRVERRGVDLFTLARTVVDEVRTTHPTRVLTLSCVGDTSGTWDADRIIQIVTNLVTNALKYSPAGTPVRVRAVGLDDGVVELTVHNQGSPIPPEQIGHLFEPLQRATDQIDHKARSVGLGLYIVDAIALAHGGTVDVTSSAEAGTMFKVRLPRQEPDRTS